MENVNTVLDRKVAASPIHQWSSGAGGVIDQQVIQFNSRVDIVPGERVCLSLRGWDMLHELICLREESSSLVDLDVPTMRHMRGYNDIQTRYADVGTNERTLIEHILFGVIAEWRIAHSPIHQWAEKKGYDVIGNVIQAHEIAPGFRHTFDILLALRGQYSRQPLNGSGYQFAMEVFKFHQIFLSGYDEMQEKFESALREIETMWRIS